MEFFQLKLTNNTKFPDEMVWIIAKGQDPGYKATPPYTKEEAYFLFDENGNGKFVHPTTLGMSSAPYAKQLSSFPKDPDNAGVYLMYLPKTEGGRIYFSLGQGVVFAVKVGYDTNLQPKVLTIADPSASLTSDPNYALIHDKIEFSFTDIMYIDTTAVDFFCMPITLTPNSLEDNDYTVGLSLTRKKILEALSGGLKGDQWPKLDLVYPVTNTVLRVVAPNVAEGFDVNYLDAYLTSIWNYYQNKQIKVDCSELAEEGKTIIYTGQAEKGASGPFVFKNDANPKEFCEINIPTSNQAFGCAGGSFNAPKDTPLSVIVRGLAAGINVGILPVASSDGNIPVLSHAFFEAHEKDYYTDKAHGDNPWYNLYSKILHSFGCKIYAFAYDDAAGQDSTLRIANGKGVYITVDLKDMSGTVLPDPDHDDKNLYDITFISGLNGSGSMVNPHDNQRYDIPGQKATTVQKVSSPFELTYSYPGQPEATYKVVVALKAAYSADGQILGVNWDGSSGTTITMALPGNK